MKELKGECKSCLGCNLLEDENFKGIDNCKNYIKEQDDELVILTIMVIEIILYIIFLFYAYYRISLVCGG